jgi:outer membrane cobalamin receptor
VRQHGKAGRLRTTRKSGYLVDGALLDRREITPKEAHVHRSTLPAFLLLAFSVSAFAAGASIRGTVIDPDGAAVAGAQVLVAARGHVVARTVTDEAGAFAIDELPADRYEVLAAVDGFRALPVGVDLHDTVDAAVTVRLQVSAIAESVVVSASHVDQPLSRTPASTTVITRDVVKRYQHPTVADALRSVPGLSISRNGGEGSLTSLFSRGGESDFTAVVIDGVPVNTFGGSYDFGALTTGSVERVEVVRGPQSALWSGGAIGGVVQIVTTPEARRLLEATGEVGARESYRAGSSAAVPLGDWRLSAGVEQAGSEGFTGPARSGEPVSNDSWLARYASIGVTRDGATRLKLSSRLARDERGVPGPFGSDPGGTYSGVDRVSRGIDHSVALGGSLARTFSRLRPGVQISWYRLDSDYASPFGDSTSASRRVNVRAGTDVRLASSLDATFGGEWLEEEARSTYITGSTGTTIPVRRGIGSLFAEGRFDRGALLLTGGARLERIHRERLDEDPNPFAPRPVLPADTVMAFTPRVSAAWFVRPADDRGEWTRIRASAGLGVRPPDAFELAFTDNPGLEPERTRSVEAGIEHALAGGLLVAEATAFLNRYDDLIVTVGRSLTDASRYRSDNISNARSRGVELLVSGRMRGGFRASVAYTYLQTEVLAVDRLGVAPPPFQPGDALLRRPRHQAWADASWGNDVANAFLIAGARGRTLDIDPSFGAFGGLYRNNGFVSADAGAAWRVISSVEVFGRVTNLFNRAYEEVLGFPAMGRSLHAGVRVIAR